MPLVASFVRQRYDTRVFKGLYARLAVDTDADQNSRGHGASIVSARVKMMRDMVGFLEAYVPAMFSQVVTVIGSLVLLFTYDIEAGFSAGAIDSVLAFVFDYLEGLDHAPTLVNSRARLQDIRARLAC